jgi:PAS domain S-box-containing protein
VYLGRVLLLALVHAVTGYYGLKYSLPGSNAAALWAPTGISIAALTLGGLRYWPFVVLGSLTTTLSSDQPWTVCLGMTLGNTLEACVGSWLLSRISFRPALDRVHDAVGLIVLGGVLAPIPSTVLGVGSMVFLGSLPGAEALSAARVWYLGNVISVLVVSPMILTWATRPPAPKAPWSEIAGAGVILGLLCVFGVLHSFEGHPQEQSFAYLPMPIMIWAALRFGLRISATFSATLCALAAAATISNRGPFVGPSVPESLALLWVFMSVSAGTAMIVAAVSAQQDRALVSLRDSEERYRLLVSGTNTIAWECGARRDTYTIIVGRGEAILGIPIERWSAPGFWRDHLHPDDRDRAEAYVAQRIEKGEDFDHEYRMVRPDGRVVWIHDSASIVRRGGVSVGVRGVMVDITQRMHARLDQARLRARHEHVRKLESLGLMAGGIAHDFNNLLTGILGNTGLLRDQLPQGSDARRTVETIEGASRRAADLCRHMLAYAGRGTLKSAPVDLGALARESVAILTPSLPPGVGIRTALAPAPPVQGDAAQLSQVLLNLLTNAAEAFDGNAGTITITAGVTHASREHLAEAFVPADLPEGEYAFLEVSDTGVGMDASTLERVFDPFFTTKFTGRGLGLAATLGIVHAHHGSIKASSTPGVGTTFRMLLPPLRGAAEATTPPAPEATFEAAHELCVLVVDDEKLVRDMAVGALKLRGIASRAVDGGPGAIEALAADPGAFHAAIIDLTMPGMSGLDALARLRAIAPGLPAVIVSGYSESDFPTPHPARTGFLHKPFTAEELLSALAGVLRSPTPTLP